MRHRPLFALTPLSILLVLATGAATAAPEPPAAGKADASALTLEAETLYASGAYSEALKKFDALLAAGQETGAILYEAGSCYAQSMGSKEKELELKKRAVPVLEKEIASGSAPVDSYYYLSAIYINDLTDPVKGTDAAKKGVALLEKPKAPAPAGQGALFRAGRLYTFLGKDAQAADYYGRSVQAADGAAVVDRVALRIALESLASSRFHEKNYDGAAEAYAGLLKLDPTRDRDRHQLGLSYLLAGKYADAESTWRQAKEDEMRTELTYLASIVRKFVDAGSPTASALVPKGSTLDDDALVQKILKAAEPLRAARERDSKAQDDARAAWEKDRQAEAADPVKAKARIAALKARKAKLAPEPPPDPNYVPPPVDPITALEQMGLHSTTPPPLLPPSPERVAAEKDFFYLLMDYVKRGHLVRNFCFENGLVEMIFR
ncbi:MAG: hypothetical protein HY049_01545 [Acidobacteria bacterium]|nr:hypothetical protein [Acidobacteriota bacterium]